MDGLQDKKKMGRTCTCEALSLYYIKTSNLKKNGKSFGGERM